MSEERWQQVRQLFESVCDLPPAQWQALAVPGVAHIGAAIVQLAQQAGLQPLADPGLIILGHRFSHGHQILAALYPE